MDDKKRKHLLIVAGTVSTATGILGIFVPILPTTPFLLLAAVCYSRSSERFYRWLLNNRFLGAYIRSYVKHEGMPIKTKLFTISLLWITIGLTIWLGVESLIIRILLVMVASGVTLHIACIKEKITKPLLTREVFDEIAPSWYNYRHYSRFRNELEALARRWGRGRLLNVGCGTGADFLPFKDAFELHGVDFSPGMLLQAEKYAAKHGFSARLVEADVRRLPFPDASFEWATAIAVYHHLDTGDDRLRALRELFRVLVPGGEALVTGWNRWQPRFWLRRRDILVPWRQREKTVYRFYHLFSRRELIRLVRQAGFEVVDKFPEKHSPLGLFARNVCLLVRKGKD
jgi:tRNA (uracil-5-)-methyltransferase TRM9